jgi:hypothetical protein
VEAKAVRQLAEAPLHEVRHVVVLTGVDDQDALLRADFRAHDETAVALANVDEDHFERTLADDVLGADEERLAPPLDLAPSVRCLLLHIEKVAPSHIAGAVAFVHRLVKPHRFAVIATAHETRHDVSPCSARRPRAADWGWRLGPEVRMDWAPCSLLKPEIPGLLQRLSQWAVASWPVGQLAARALQPTQADNSGTPSYRLVLANR